MRTTLLTISIWAWAACALPCTLLGAWLLGRPEPICKSGETAKEVLKQMPHVHRAEGQPAQAISVMVLNGLPLGGISSATQSWQM